MFLPTALPLHCHNYVPVLFMVLFLDLRYFVWSLCIICVLHYVILSNLITSQQRYNNNWKLQVFHIVVTAREPFGRKMTGILNDRPTSVALVTFLTTYCRQAPDESSNSLESDLNVDTAYTGQYPVMFNIILWMMVVLALTVFAVSYGMWYMDPGRDSIIYRMTSQRLKTDWASRRLHRITQCQLQHVTGRVRP